MAMCVVCVCKQEFIILFMQVNITCVSMCDTVCVCVCVRLLVVT